MRGRWRSMVRGLAVALALAGAMAAMGAGLGGCAGLGMSANEVRLLDASTADARFMARTWADRSEAEREAWVAMNAAAWMYFDDLAHGRRPTVDPAGRTGEATGDE